MAINVGNADMGASMLARILRDHPEQLAARIRLAQLRLRQNGTSSALNILEPVRDSTDPGVTRLYAIIYLQTHRAKDALYALRKLNDENAANMPEKRALALLEMQAGNVDQAINVLAPAVAQEPSNPTVVEPYIDVLIQKHRYPEALKVADKYGSDPKQRAKALAYRGTILMLQHDAAGARAAFDKSVAIDPSNISALFARATFLTANQKYADASRDLKAILALDAKNMGAVMKLAEIAVRQGNDPAVRTLYGQAIALSPNVAAPRIALTLHLIFRQDIKGALTAAQGCARAQPNNDDCTLLLGKVQATLGQKKEAIASFRRLVALRPDMASAQLLLSAALLLVGDRASAARALDAAVELDPQGEAVRRAQIDFQIGSGNPNAAVALARDFQSSNPGTAADLLLAASLERARHNDEAAAVLNKSLSERADSLILMQLVHLALVSNDRKHAGDLMSKWLANRPRDTAVRMQYATILLQQDEEAKAISQYQIIVKQTPNNIDALNNLSWLIQDSEPKRAQSLLARALQLSPNSSHVADSLGWLKVRQKDAAGGLALLHSAHKLEADNPTITYHLVVALDANAKRGEALNLLKPLLASGTKFADRPEALQLYAAWRR
jgi:putative PEP-CTERM system TPR-repeat lipoprotein